MKYNKKIQIFLLLTWLVVSEFYGCKKDEPLVKKDPSITWTIPADISYGTLLSTTQLNAVANVPGTFVYTPPSGTRLNVGTKQELKTYFSPTDSATYNRISKTVTINITPGSGITFGPGLTYGSLTDQDGNVYKTISIGTQTWMAENLRTTKYRNGDPIQNVSDSSAWNFLTTGAYCWYLNNEINNKTVYGALYNWFTVVDSRNIAPAGWHVPTKEEWVTLISNQGFEGAAGKNLKETGNAHWVEDHFYPTTATNESGFTALPGGVRDRQFGIFRQLGSYSYYWSTTEYNLHESVGLYMCNTDTHCLNSPFLKELGFSVRCVKD